MARRLDLANVSTHVMGKVERKTKKPGKSDLRTSRTELPDITPQLDKYILSTQLPGGSYVKIDQKISSKYEYVGIHSFTKFTKSNVDHYRMEIGLVSRDRGDVRLADTGNDFLVREVKLEEGERQAQIAYAIFVPSTARAVVDDALPFSVISHLFRSILWKTVEREKYLLEEHELTAAVRCSFFGSVKDQYDAALNEDVTELDYTFVKPKFARKNINTTDAATLEQDELIGSTLGQMLAKAFGGNIEGTRFSEYPYMKVKVSVQIDSASAQAKDLQEKARAKAKELTAAKDFLSSASCSYRDPETDELVRVMLRGKTLNCDSQLCSPDDRIPEKIWDEMVECYLKLREEQEEDDEDTDGT